MTVPNQPREGNQQDGSREAAVVPLGVALVTDSLALAYSVGLVFAFSRAPPSARCCWASGGGGLTDVDAVAGMLTGGIQCGTAILLGSQLASGGQGRKLLTQPTACSGTSAGRKRSPRPGALTPQAQLSLHRQAHTLYPQRGAGRCGCYLAARGSMAAISSTTLSRKASTWLSSYPSSPLAGANTARRTTSTLSSPLSSM